jgi:hypothetical protein
MLEMLSLRDSRLNCECHFLLGLDRESNDCDLAISCSIRIWTVEMSSTCGISWAKKLKLWLSRLGD